MLQGLRQAVVCLGLDGDLFKAPGDVSGLVRYNLLWQVDDDVTCIFDNGVVLCLYMVSALSLLVLNACILL